MREHIHRLAFFGAVAAGRQHVEVAPDGLIIQGGAKLRGGTVDGANDHRVVMAAAVAATVADGPVRITDARAIDKSYPDFFRDFVKLGGRVHVE